MVFFEDASAKFEVHGNICLQLVLCFDHKILKHEPGKYKIRRY